MKPALPDKRRLKADKIRPVGRSHRFNGRKAQVIHWKYKGRSSWLKTLLVIPVKFHFEASVTVGQETDLNGVFPQWQEFGKSQR
jgi:hypothetical protein